MQIPKIEGEYTLCTGNTFIHSANVLVQLEPHHSLSVWDFLLFQWSGSRQAESAKREAGEIKWTVHSTCLIETDRGWINKEQRVGLEKKRGGSAAFCKNILPRMEVSFIPALVSLPSDHSFIHIYLIFILYPKIFACVVSCHPVWPLFIQDDEFKLHKLKLKTKVYQNIFGQTTLTAFLMWCFVCNLCELAARPLFSCCFYDC